MNPADVNPDFSVSLSGPSQMGSECAVGGCRDYASLLVSLAYCFCPKIDREHGARECGTPVRDVDRNECTVCEKHGAVIAHAWECFERLSNYTAAKAGA